MEPLQITRCYIYMKEITTNNNNNNITFIRPYATQAHGHKPYIHIYNTVINWKKPTYMYMSLQTEINTSCTDRDPFSV